MMYSEIHIWGDSLARGITYQESKGRYAISSERCSTRLQQTFHCKVENHSKMGATVVDGLALFSQFEAVPQALCAVEFGGNDCDLDWAYVAQHSQEPVQAKVPLDVFESELTQFVQNIRQLGMIPLLVTPLPLHAERYFRWVTKNIDANAVLQALGDVHHIYRWQERYAIAVRKVARATHCRLLDVRDMLLARADYEQLMCIDGIHPSDLGHKVLAQAVLASAMQRPEIIPQQAYMEAMEAQETSIPSAAI